METRNEISLVGGVGGFWHRAALNWELFTFWGYFSVFLYFQDCIYCECEFWCKNCRPSNQIMEYKLQVTLKKVFSLFSRALVTCWHFCLTRAMFLIIVTTQALAQARNFCSPGLTAGTYRKIRRGKSPAFLTMNITSKSYGLPSRTLLVKPQFVKTNFLQNKCKIMTNTPDKPLSLKPHRNRFFSALFFW